MFRLKQGGEWETERRSRGGGGGKDGVDGRVELLNGTPTMVMYVLRLPVHIHQIYIFVFSPLVPPFCVHTSFKVRWFEGREIR